jgi:DNA replication protein DnaC
LFEKTKEDGTKEYGYKKGIVFYGLTGRGKTHAMHAIRKYLSGGMRGYFSNIQTWQEILFEMSLYYNDSRSFPNVVARLKDKNFIFIDDLGAEKETENSNVLLFMIINDAYENGKPLFISTNLNLIELNTRYGERITSRLSEMCEFYEVVGDNKRIN